ncbi:hypothetical protein T492DRAFT_947375 [Pavlovales sp. CCMP2436]|nr:hypothetical protein T492DRAFT_947375 [Pavlovales sp. CCMP2436]
MREPKVNSSQSRYAQGIPRSPKPVSRQHEASGLGGGIIGGIGGSVQSGYALGLSPSPQPGPSQFRDSPTVPGPSQFQSGINREYQANQYQSGSPGWRGESGIYRTVPEGSPGRSPGGGPRNPGDEEMSPGFHGLSAMGSTVSGSIPPARGLAARANAAAAARAVAEREYAVALATARAAVGLPSEPPNIPGVDAGGCGAPVYRQRGDTGREIQSGGAGAGPAVGSAKAFAYFRETQPQQQPQPQSGSGGTARITGVLADSLRGDSGRGESGRGESGRGESGANTTNAFAFFRSATATAAAANAANAANVH